MAPLTKKYVPMGLVLGTEADVLPLEAPAVTADLVESDTEVLLLVEVGLVVVLKGDAAVGKEGEGMVQHVQHVSVGVVP